MSDSFMSFKTPQPLLKSDIIYARSPVSEINELPEPVPVETAYRSAVLPSTSFIRPKSGQKWLKKAKRAKKLI